MQRNPTLRDIAKLADVSLSTVSLVLNNRPNVTPEMRERVLKAAETLGYRQKIVTHTPLVSGLKTIGLLTKRQYGEPLIINPFYSHVIAGVEQECQRHNINLMYASVEVDAHSRTVQWPPMLLNELVDGVIVVGAFFEEAIADIRQRIGRNVVLVDSYTSDDTLYDSVVIDNFGGAFKAVNALIEHGHRDIGLIGSSPDSYPSIFERRQGYLAALDQHRIKNAYMEDGLLTREDAYQAAMRLLRGHYYLTAIFACNDECAIGVMNAVRDNQWRVPHDVSLIGFDDIDLAQQVQPTLSTLHVDKMLMGSMALRMLLDRAHDPDRPATRTVIPTRLMMRESVRTRTE